MGGGGGGGGHVSNPVQGCRMGREVGMGPHSTGPSNTLGSPSTLFYVVKKSTSSQRLGAPLPRDLSFPCSGQHVAALTGARTMLGL